MPAILTTIGTLRPDGARALDRYAAVVVPLIERAGGVVLARGAFREGVVGDDFPGFVAVMQFPDAESVHAMFESDAYRAAVSDRDDAFQELTTFISDPV